MHPADEFEAFQKLIANGKSVADVAARFGVSEAVVNRRLALARVSPVLLKQYRSGEIDLELLQAFTLTDDHATQEKIWERLQPWDHNPNTVRHLLSKDDIPATDKRVRFVGLSNYEAAGGFVKRDLFHDNEHGVYVTDAAKLNRLVNERLEAIAGQLKADGWKWVDVRPDPDYQFLGRHKRLPPREIPLSPELEGEIETLEKEYECLNEELSEEEGYNQTGDNERIYERIDEIENRLQEIRRHGQYEYAGDLKAASGVVVTIGFNGEPEFACRNEDGAALANTATNESVRSAQLASQRNGQASSAYSASLVETLTMHKTAAIAAELAQQPKIALSAVVHALMLSEFSLDLGI